MAIARERLNGLEEAFDVVTKQIHGITGVVSSDGVVHGFPQSFDLIDPRVIHGLEQEYDLGMLSEPE